MAALRIASFNLESLDDRPGQAPALAERIAALRPQLLRLRADVLCMQEVNGQRKGKRGPRRLAALARLIEGTPYQGMRLLHTSGEAASALDVHNLAVLTGLPVLDWAQHRHDFAPPLRYRPASLGPAAEEIALTFDRPLLRVLLEAPGGRRLHLVNLHLRAPLAAPLPGQKSGPFAWRSAAAWAEGYFMSEAKRSGQALEARLLVDDILNADPEALVCVCGDFNAEARETPVRLVMAGEEDTGAGALAGRALVSLERSLPRSRRFTVRHRGRAQMVDHMLISRGLLAFYRGLEAHNEALGDEVVAFAGVDRSPESFHAPLVAEFEFP
jgi:endonuclease/exonuclease/phosphatase family metal-dependent hydrolase